MGYAYYISDDMLSDEYDDINEVLQNAVYNIEEDNTYVYSRNYIIVNIVETEDYNDNFKSKFLKLLEDINEIAYYDGIEDYLNGMNIHNFANEITEIWNKYKKIKGIRNYYTDKNGTQKTYKIYIKKDEDFYSLINYEIIE